MGNAADCKACNNRGTYWGCRKCKRVNRERIEQLSKEFNRGER